MIDNKTMLIGGAAAVVGLLTIVSKKSVDTDSDDLNLSTKNHTLYIPTTETNYNLEYVLGDKTTQSTTSYATNTQSVGDNSVFTSEVVQTPTKTPNAIVDMPIQKETTPIEATKEKATATPSTSQKETTNTTIDYTIKKGDTLWSIVEDNTGSVSMAKVNEIAKANNISDPNKIYAGATIVLPTTTTKTNATTTTTKTNATATTTAKTTTAKTTTVTYTVVKGDTLSAIAKKYSTTVAKIQKDNPSITNANKINIGQKIKIVK